MPQTFSIAISYIVFCCRIVGHVTWIHAAWFRHFWWWYNNCEFILAYYVIYVHMCMFAVDDINILQRAATRVSTPLAQWRTTVGRFYWYSQICDSEGFVSHCTACDEKPRSFPQQLCICCHLCHRVCRVCCLSQVPVPLTLAFLPTLAW